MHTHFYLKTFAITIDCSDDRFCTCIHRHHCWYKPLFSILYKQANNIYSAKIKNWIKGALHLGACTGSKGCIHQWHNTVQNNAIVDITLCLPLAQFHCTPLSQIHADLLLSHFEYMPFPGHYVQWATMTMLPSVLWCCWLGGKKGIWPVKNWVVGCWCGFLSGARCRLAYGPADATATHCLLLQ